MNFYRNIPNLLSLSRIVFAFGVGGSLLCCDVFASIIFMFIAGVTDFFDGYFARKFQIVSEFGARLDPLADKILMFVTYIAMAYMNMIPTFVVYVVVFRDLMILSGVLACFYHRKSLKMEPLMSSKINTAVQIAYLLFVLACNYFHLHITLLTKIFAWAVVATTVWSGAEYVQKYQWIARLFFKR